METPYDRHYVEARETLLDAVEALGAHRDAVILVGAQAIYVHTEDEAASVSITSRTLPGCGASISMRRSSLISGNLVT